MIHIGSGWGSGGSGEHARGGSQVVPRGQVQDHTGRYRTDTGPYRSRVVWQHQAGTNCVFWLHATGWWYLVVVDSCMQSSMGISSGDKYRSWYVVPTAQYSTVKWLGLVWVRPGRF